MNRRTKLFMVGIALLLGVAVCMVTAVLINYAVGVNDSGSPELASEWKESLQPLTQSTDDLRKEHPGLEIIHFPDGEWVMGFSQNSHGLFVPGGGTIVVKDSRGNVRAFFGHVCGPHYLSTFFREPPDLDRFYARVNQLHFTEHLFP